MKAPLDVQLREYSDFFDEQLREVTVEDILSHPITDGSVRPLQPRKPAVSLRPNLGRRVVVAGVTALVLAVLIAAAALLSRSSGDVAPSATDPPAPPTTSASVPETGSVAPPATDSPVPPTTSASVPETGSVAPPATDSPVPPTTSASVTETGSVETPLGTLTWESVTEVIGVETWGGMDVVVTPTGFAAIGRQIDRRLSRLSGLSMWTSPDGLHWEEQPPPFASVPASVRLTWQGDRGWLVTDEPASLWTSTDGEAWTQVDMSPLQPPPSTGLDWHVTLRRPMAAGPRTVFQWTARPQLPLDDIFGTDLSGVEVLGLGWDWDGDGVFEVTDMIDESPVVARIRLEETALSGVVVDADTGEELHRYGIDVPDSVDGTEPEDGALSFSWNLFAAIEPDGTVDVVETPWNPASPPDDFAGVNGAAFAFFAEGARAGELWKSTDAISWSLAKAPGTGGILFDDGETLYLDVHAGPQAPTEDPQRWVSVDGLSWRELTSPPWHVGSGPRRFADGYVLLSQFDTPKIGSEGFIQLPRPKLWVSANGTDWEELPTDRIFPLHRDLGRDIYFGLAVAGEKLFVSATDESNALVGFWVLELQARGGS